MIEETRKKANEVKARQQAKMERELKRDAHLMRREMDIQKNLEKNITMRESNRSARDLVERNMLEQKKDKVLMGKMHSEAMLNEKIQRETNDVQMNRRRSEDVKKSKEEAKSRNAALRAAKSGGHREDYENRIAREDEMKAQTEALIQRMEREEMELIQRLQNTHSVQQSAMAELENTIASTVGPRGGPSHSKSQEWSVEKASIDREEAGLRPDRAA